MADDKNSFDEMMNFWKDGQEAFVSAQKDIAENFTKAFTPKPVDPVSQSIDAWQKFVAAWAPSWDPSTAMAAMNANAAAKGTDALYSMLDPSNWMAQAPEQLRKILDNIAQVPQFADIAMPQADMAEQWQDVMNFQEAAGQFGTVMRDAWKRAYDKYSKEFSVEDLTSGKVQEALNAWIKTANDELLDTQASQDFMTAQKDMIKASAALQKRQSAAAEQWASAYQMPTRSEIDDLTETVSDLKRELRKIKRELKAAKAK